MSAISGGGGAGGGEAGQGDPAVSTQLDMDEMMLGFVGPSSGAGDGAQGGVQDGARQGGDGQGALLADSHWPCLLSVEMAAVGTPLSIACCCIWPALTLCPRR